MKHFSIRTVLTGCISLLTAVSLFAGDSNAIVDDNEDGTDQNKFEQYWYYYDDNSGTKEDDRPQADSASTPSEILVTYTEKPREAFGNVEDTWLIKEYDFLIDSDPSNKFASMPFEYGDPWTASYGEAMPYVGMGTMLAADGKSIDLTGALTTSFKIRCRENDELTVVFKIETKDIAEDSSFAYYQKSFVVGREWQTVTIGLNEDEIGQPGWTPIAAERDFDITNITKLAWEVPGNVNDITGDTLDVDDVIITSYTFISPTVWPNSDPEPVSENMFSTFEETDKAGTPLNTYWFAYTDGEIGGTSAISSGATTNEETGRLSLSFEPGSGSDGAGHAAFIEFLLGPTIDKPNTANPEKIDNVQGFAGIGFNVYDSATSTFFDATTAQNGAVGPTEGVDGIYFEYLADGDFNYVTLEVSDIHDVGDATAQVPQYSRGSGIVHYRNFQKTGLATWRAGRLRFADLIVNDSWEGFVDIPLDISKLAKIQFKVQGAEGDAGNLFIDNVRFTSPVSAKRRSIRAASPAGFSAVYGNGMVTVNWKNNHVQSGSIRMLDIKGATVATVPVAATTGSASRISAKALSAGLYFVQLRGTDRNGAVIDRQTAVSVVR